ncbi:tetratricopeptide repeat protein, partial [Frankia umida]|uniref:tetratricopeptide repeat protein n=1 Tax=Frankia umida TaxID=573489 RepID=UPI00200CBEC5
MGVAGPVPPGQVVEIRAVRADGRTRVGSGLLITGRLVLTAAHVVFPEGPVASSRVGLTVGVGETGRAGTSGRVVWPERWDGPGGTAPDAALIRIDDPGWIPPRVDRLRWGALTGRAGGIAGEAAGFPRVLRGAGGARETNHLTGQVNPLGGLVTGRYDINVKDHPPLAPTADDEPLPWSGMSGAVLYACADPTGPAPVWLATAVIVVDTPGFGEGRLSAVPVRRLLDDPGLRDLIRAEGGPVDWESVELAGLISPPTVTVPRTPAQFLRADAEIVDLHGREALLSEFTDWCAGAADSAVRLLVGPGGQGKTRFARALSARLREAGWLAGLVRPEGVGLVGRLAGQTRPVLLVVDYAETHTDLTSTLLGILEERSSRIRVRLLLVARGGGDWWDDLTGRHPLAADGQTLPLAAVESSGPNRTRLFTDAAGTFAHRLTDLDPTVDWTARAEHVHRGIPDLSDSGFGLVLAVHMAALTALLDQPDTHPGGSPVEVADRLLRHEKTYWTDTARTGGITRSADSLEQAIATATLCGAQDVGEATATLARLPGFAGDDGEAHDLRGRVVRWLAGLYPPPPEQAGQVWGGISPDRLAEHFLARHLTDPTDTPGVAFRVLTGASRAQIYQALTVLNRAAPAHPRLTGLLPALLAADPAARAPVALQVTVEAADHTPTADALTALAPRLDLPTLTTMTDGLPQYSHRLLDLAAVVQQAHTARLRDHTPGLPPARRWVLPRRRTIPPDTYLPDLATSLNNLSVRLGAVGRPEQALATIEEAVTIRRRLAADRPDTYLPDLATSLNNQSVQLGAVGRPEQALATIEEAVTIRRRLAADRPDTYLPDLATSL